MNKARRFVVAGLGAMTLGVRPPTDQVQAPRLKLPRLGPPRAAPPTIALDPGGRLKSALLGLSPAEKLRIAGDRIRVAMPERPENSTVKGLEAFAYIQLLADGIEFRGQPVDDDLRHADWSNPSEPGLHSKPFNVSAKGRNIRREGVALGRG